mgnify:CR=1 FL=1
MNYGNPHRGMGVNASKDKRTDYSMGSRPYQETDTGPGLMMSGGPMSRDRYRGEVRGGLFKGMELSPPDLQYRGEVANSRNRQIRNEARDKVHYSNQRIGSDRQAMSGYSSENRVYDDFIINDLINQGSILPSEVYDIGEDGYKQVRPRLMGQELQGPLAYG